MPNRRQTLLGAASTLGIAGSVANASESEPGQGCGGGWSPSLFYDTQTIPLDPQIAEFNAHRSGCLVNVSGYLQFAKPSGGNTIDGYPITLSGKLPWACIPVPGQAKDLGYSLALGRVSGIDFNIYERRQLSAVLIPLANSTAQVKFLWDQPKGGPDIRSLTVGHLIDADPSSSSANVVLAFSGVYPTDAALPKATD